MKKTLTVLFIIAMLISSTQTFRHVYVKWLEPTHSVLDAFKNELETGISKAKTLDDLVILYQEAQQKVKKYESNQDNPIIKQHNKSNTEPYESEYKIKREIQNREFDKNQLYKLWFYWLCGIASLVVGLITFKKINKWLGFSGIVIGFTEMLGWTSPLFHNRLLSQQFEYLLNYKLLLSLITWILLITLWLLLEKNNILSRKV